MGNEGKPPVQLVAADNQTVSHLGNDAFGGVDFVPVIISEVGSDATRSFLSFFVDHIRNKNTRDAYLRAVNRFFDWAELRGLTLDRIQSFHVSGYIEELGKTMAIPTVKQNLAALRMLFDWLMIRQVCRTNPCHAVRGPKLKITSGKTIALDEADAKRLLTSIPTNNLVGLRDRALIALMTYTFARVSAALSMDVEDYEPRGRRMWIRLLEKGSRVHAMPAHHKLEEYLDSYIRAADLASQPKSPLFRSAIGRTGKLTTKRLLRANAWDAVRRRARNAGVQGRIGNHSFRATGVTNYLTNGGKLETAQQMAGHADARTTKLYDRRNDQISLDEIERITI
ncbi:MAG: tyrosine-type recombinase/integrase [Planctomycetota bacterium]